ncbi:MAG: methionyl-tRNA formyltransferase, partial [Bacteroidaceae bacterium]|nr:methionyl-tRNA formyltransferase [Bacteroidaceae bacterium]
YPAAWTTLDGVMLKVYRVKNIPDRERVGNAVPGTIDTDGKNYLYVACKDGWVALESLQLAGKRRMDIRDFLRGAHISVASVE